MVILPIKKKWFDMIVSGEKKEEYREIKPYYTSRFIKALGFPGKSEREDVKELLKQMQALKSIEIMFRNGYSVGSPAIIAECHLSIGMGKEKWGAKLGEKYYILRIDKIRKEAATMLEFEESDSSCMICGAKEIAGIEKMKIIRKGGENLVIFSICEDCRANMYYELKEHTEDNR